MQTYPLGLALVSDKLRLILAVDLQCYIVLPNDL